MGLSESSVASNPLVNPHYPYWIPLNVPGIHHFQMKPYRGLLKPGYLIIHWWIFHEINHPALGARPILGRNIHMVVSQTSQFGTGLYHLLMVMRALGDGSHGLLRHLFLLATCRMAAALAAPCSRSSGQWPPSSMTPCREMFLDPRLINKDWWVLPHKISWL